MIQGSVIVSFCSYFIHAASAKSFEKGLEYLKNVDQLLVHQNKELTEVFTGFETKNKFQIRDNSGQNIFFAIEDSDAFTRVCTGASRPFKLKVFDNSKHEVMCFKRSYNFFLQSIEVFAPPGVLVGTVQQETNLLRPIFVVTNACGNSILQIKGPLSTGLGEADFTIKSVDGSRKLGKISKKWSGFAREAFTDADNFGISFPVDLDVKLKATLLGALFLIDMMYFER